MAFKKLKGFVRGVLADVGLTSAASRDEVRANFADHGLRSGRESDAISSLSSPTTQWLRLPIMSWGATEIRSWVRHMAPFGTASHILNAFGDLNLTNGHRIRAASYVDYVLALKDVSENLFPIKPEPLAMLILQFAYVKECYARNRLFDSFFGYCLSKVFKTQYIDEYQRLLSLVMLGKLEIEGDEEIDRLCCAVTAYAYILLNRHSIFERFRDYFDERLSTLPLGQDTFPLVCKIILVDQVAEQGRAQGMTAEQAVLSGKTKRLLSPLVSHLPFLKPEFGFFHVGLQIGSELNYLEWTTCSFICPRALESVDSLLSIDLEPILIHSGNCEDIADVISEVVYTFNAQKEYTLVSMNCQHFVLEMCKALGLDVRKQLNEGALAKFLSRIKNSGSSEMVFQPSSEFLQRYELGDVSTLSIHFSKFLHERNRSGVFRFETHMDLDEFGISLLGVARRVDGDEEMVRRTVEWKLLKGWDEAAWIRYFSSKKGEVEREEFEKYVYYHRVVGEEGNENEILCPYLSMNTPATPATPRVGDGTFSQEHHNHHHIEMELSEQIDLTAFLSGEREIGVDDGEGEGEGEGENEIENENGQLTVDEERIRQRILAKNEEWNERWYENYSQTHYSELLRSQILGASVVDESSQWMFD